VINEDVDTMEGDGKFVHLESGVGYLPMYHIFLRKKHLKNEAETMIAQKEERDTQTKQPIDTNICRA